MSVIEERLAARGFVLPPPLKVPAGVSLPFQFVRVIGTRAIISGHGPQDADGSISRPLGKVGRELTVEQAHEAARAPGSRSSAACKRALGDLDRIVAWGRVFGMVNSAPGSTSSRPSSTASRT
jgi:hypothetical protein